MNENILEFSIFCIERLAEALQMDAEKVYKIIRMDTNVLGEYIIPCYGALHSQSKKYIVEDLIEVIREKGAIQ
ncbi:MAG: DUF3791 domain-containing protein [Cellulosilyticaceae bacterium]